MWQAAVELAKRHGLHRTAQSLPIDYGSLKKRIATGKPALPKFLEFLAPTSMAGCTVELESPHGKLRVEMNSAPDWTQLLRAWRQA